MKTTTPRLALSLAVVFLGALPIALSEEVPSPVFVPPIRTDKLIVLDCSHGWRAAAQGQYGGVGFELFCKNGKDRVRIDGLAGTAYSMRVGAESSSVGLDCFFSGDEASVDVSCANAARVTIR